MTVALMILVWSLVGLVGATYVGYPILLWLLSRFHGTPQGASLTESLPVTLVVSIHNEEAVLPRKLENCAALVVGPWPFKVLIVDDASNDASKGIAQQWCNDFPELFAWVGTDSRGGKNRALNKALESVPDGIVVFSDANAFYDPHAVGKLVDAFQDPGVGCVVGELRLVKQGRTLEGAYWKYENAIKGWESALGRMVVANGAIFAARRECIEPLLPGVANDLQVPLSTNRKGLATIFRPEAFAEERVSDSTGEEFQRKARMATRGLTGLVPMFRQARGTMKLQYLFHKVFRWFTGAFLVGILFGSVLLMANPVFAVLLGLQGAFYALALVGWVLERRGVSAGVMGFPWYFVSMQVAGLVATGRWLLGHKVETWSKPASTRKPLD